MHNRATNILKWFAASVIGIAVIWGVYYVVTHTSQAKRELTLATTRQPETLTELYFADAEALPSSLVVTEQELPVSFVIANREAKTMEYTYRVTFSDGKQTVTTPDGSVILQDGQSQAITQSIKVPAGTARGEVSVQIINKSQRIHFWLERL
ncbi:MAG TPA: hypothetical protein VLA88_03480 [Candidatus Saccharimonadales bacterium]|nr:hypothetical protein [Candidatus Saccharimonadales bacterium]